MSESTLRSRRALLVGAAGGAAAVAANAALPMSRALAVDEPLLLNVTNNPTATTSLNASLAMGTAFSVTNSASGDNTALQANSDFGAALGAYTGSGYGLYADAMGAGIGARGSAGTAGTGVAGLCGDSAGAPSNTSYTGVFGYSEAGDGVNTFGSGVWGVSDDIGVYGSGSTGVVGDGGSTGTGVEGYSGSGYGLYVTGKIKLANRSGRLAVPKGRTSIARNVPGMSSTNIVIAVLQTAETGTWVRAAVAASGKFTVYFNKALPTSSIVGWIVLN